MAELREADVLIGQGKRVAGAVRTLGVRRDDPYRWHRDRARPPQAKV